MTYLYAMITCCCAALVGTGLSVAIHAWSRRLPPVPPLPKSAERLARSHMGLSPSQQKALRIWPLALPLLLSGCDMTTEAWSWAPVIVTGSILPVLALSLWYARLRWGGAVTTWRGRPVWRSESQPGKWVAITGSNAGSFRRTLPGAILAALRGSTVLLCLAGTAHAVEGMPVPCEMARSCANEPQPGPAGNPLPLLLFALGGLAVVYSMRKAKVLPLLMLLPLAGCSEHVVLRGEPAAIVLGTAFALAYAWGRQRGRRDGLLIWAIAKEPGVRGYDLHKQLGLRTASAYPDLHRLEDDGILRSEPVPPPVAPWHARGRYYWLAGLLLLLAASPAHALVAPGAVPVQIECDSALERCNLDLAAVTSAQPYERWSSLWERYTSLRRWCWALAACLPLCVLLGAFAMLRRPGGWHMFGLRRRYCLYFGGVNWWIEDRAVGHHEEYRFLLSALLDAYRLRGGR